MNELTLRQLTAEFILQLFFQMMFLLPSAWLCYLTIGWKNLRCSPRKLVSATIGAVLLYAIIYFFLWLYFDVGNPVAVLPFMVLAFLYFRHIADRNTYPLLFVFICSVLYAKINISLFRFLAESLFPVSDFISHYDLWRPVDMVVMSVTTAATLPAASWLMTKKIRPLLGKAQGRELLLCLLPMAFILLMAVDATQNIYHWVEESIVSFLLIIAVLSTLQSAAVMYQTRKSTQKEEALRQVSVQLKTQRERFAELLEYNRQVRVLRHDMRHHLLVLEGMLTEGRYREAENYLKEYSASVEPAEHAPLCENYVADVIARHYQAEAAALDIKTDFLISLPQSCGIADADLCIVLGNLLENAVKASKSAKGSAFIRLRVKAEGEEILIAVDNSCGKESPPPGTGLGIPSVQAVARNYGGMAKLERSKTLFQASVLLTKKLIP